MHAFSPLYAGAGIRPGVRILGECFSWREMAVESTHRPCGGRRPNEQEQLRRLWAEGLASGPGRFETIDDIKSEARRRLRAAIQ